ncbi:MAG: hypothetical protein R2759_18835 [Bacteroidales bacterium]
MEQSLKDKKLMRWLVLFLIAFVQAANYYFYDVFSPLKRHLEESFHLRTDLACSFQYILFPMFSVNVYLGGIILDRLGIRRTGFLFVILMTW